MATLTDGEAVEVPSIIPTDKLHKFTAVAGLIIIALALRLWWTTDRARHDALRQLNVELAVLEEDSRELGRRAARADSLRDPTLRPSCDEVAMLRRQAVRIRSVATSSAKDTWPPIVIVLLLGAVGYTMAIWGFREWYADEHPPTPPKILEP